MNILNHVFLIRFGCFLSVLILMAVLELVMPCRKLLLRKTDRWLTNLGIVILNVLTVRLVFFLTVVDFALRTELQHVGLFNQLSLPFFIKILLSIIALDFIIYLQHVMFHAIPILWRFHMIHHADRDFDVTTGLRFHPVEIVVSMGIKFASIYLLGISAVAVLLFEVILNATAMFNHSNIRLPLKLDSILRLFLVTPDMHRIHHSVVLSEANSNFGFNLPIWDRFCGTYRAQPFVAHTEMTIGLTQFQKAPVEKIYWILSIPFRGKLGGYAINR